MSDQIHDDAGPYPDTAQAGASLHAWLEPVRPFLGHWRGRGQGGYPTLAAGFAYEQQVSLAHDGRPFLRYEARAWLVDGDGTPIRPSGREVGWWRVMPDGYLEAVIAHPTGIVETYTGQVSGTTIEMTTKDVAVTPTAKEVSGARRRYGLTDGCLTYVHELEAVGQPMQHHLSARLEAQQH